MLNCDIHGWINPLTVLIFRESVDWQLPRDVSRAEVTQCKLNIIGQCEVLGVMLTKDRTAVVQVRPSMGRMLLMFPPRKNVRHLEKATLPAKGNDDTSTLYLTSTRLVAGRWSSYCDS